MHHITFRALYRNLTSTSIQQRQRKKKPWPHNNNYTSELQLHPPSIFNFSALVRMCEIVTPFYGKLLPAQTYWNIIVCRGVWLSLSLSCFPCSCRLLCFPWLHVNFTAANSFKCCMFFVRSVDVCMPFSLRCFTALTNNIPFLFHQFCSQTQANLPRFKKFRLITYCVLFLSLFHHLHIFPR